MIYFADRVIKPYLSEAGYRRICEVGASFGENTRKLLEVEAVSLVVVDPCLDTDLTRLQGGRVSVRRGLSLDELAAMDGPFDCMLLDGDHNWYTVYNELRLIDERALLRPGGTVFLHDVGWPYGRRDMYYQPETIPPEFVQPHAARGIVAGRSELSDTGGINAERLNAAHEGGPRNGVLTAVEDFLRERPGKYRFLVVPEEHGLGVLHRRGSLRDALPWLRLYAARKQGWAWRGVRLALRTLAPPRRG
jgi:hypothetical protein